MLTSTAFLSPEPRANTSRLSPQQRHSLFAQAAEFASGRITVYAGVTDSGFRAVRSHIEAAKAAGVDCCVAGLPYYFPRS